MGATASINPEVFALAKAEYEKKQAEGCTDEQLFNHMKAFIEAMTAEKKADAVGLPAETPNEGETPAATESQTPKPEDQKPKAEAETSEPITEAPAVEAPKEPVVAVEAPAAVTVEG